MIGLQVRRRSTKAGGHAPPIFIATSRANGLTLNTPAGTQVGDLLVAFCLRDSTSGAWGPPASDGWNATTERTFSAQGAAVFWKIAGAGDVGGSSKTFTSGGGAVDVLLATWRGLTGVALAGFRNGPDEGFGSTTSHVVDATTLSPSGPNLQINWWGSRFTSGVWGQPAGFTEQIDGSAGGNFSEDLSWKWAAAGGAVGTTTTTSSIGTAAAGFVLAFTG